MSNSQIELYVSTRIGPQWRLKNLYIVLTESLYFHILLIYYYYYYY